MVSHQLCRKDLFFSGLSFVFVFGWILKEIQTVFQGMYANCSNYRPGMP